MNDLTQAIVQRFLQFGGDNAPRTLAVGGIHRMLAPKRAGYPRVILTGMGGPIDRMFGPASVESERIQVGVWDEFNGDARLAWRIWDGMRALMDNKLFTLENGAHMLLRLDANPQEVIEDDLLHVFGVYLSQRHEA